MAKKGEAPSEAADLAGPCCIHCCVTPSKGFHPTWHLPSAPGLLAMWPSGGLSISQPQLAHAGHAAVLPVSQHAMSHKTSSRPVPMAFVQGTEDASARQCGLSPSE